MSSARAGSTTQELTLTVSDGTKLACGLVLPGGSPPDSGWPGLLLFPGLGQTHAAMETIANASFAPAGFASLTCDERGTGASGGAFDLAGPTDVQDVHDLFTWLAARSYVSDTEIGAFGLSAGGAEVWNAAAAGVPFEAIVPADTWTSLSRALLPNGVVKTGLLDALTRFHPPASWSSASGLAARSSRDRLHALTVPAFAVQSRQDSSFDLDQATAAYRLLAGPKRLYAGDVPRALPEIVAWFEKYLAAGPAVSGGVELAHDPWDGATSVFRSLPPTRSVSVNLPGGATRRSVRLTGGPLETFGDGLVTVRYAGATPSWTQLVATVTVKGRKTPVTEGAALVSGAAGVVAIPLLDEAALLPRGKRLVVTLGASSPDGVFAGNPPAGAAITLGRVTLELSVLRLAVSR